MDKRLPLHERPVEGRPDADGPHQAALLIDFDNVTMGIRSNLGQELRNLLNSEVIRGKVAVQRAYADWRRYPQYIVPLSEASIDLIFAPAYGSSKKNATDIRLAIDALELVFIRPEIRTFILMSGDSDFSSLVLKLKEYGKYVIGVGIQESSSDLLVQNCDEYYSFSSLSGLSKAGDQPLERHDPWALVEKSVAKMVERGDTMRSDRLKQVMLEIDPSFNEKEQGFNKFNRFVVEAASRGLVSIQKMENGQYGVAPVRGDAGPKEERAPAKESRAQQRRGGGRRKRDEREPKEPRPEAQAPERGRGREPGRSRREPGGRREGDRGREGESTRRARPKLTRESALELLNRALGQLLEGKDESVRDSDVKRRILELDPGFDEGELGFSKFSKFLQAAEEARAVQLTRGPNGNFYVDRAGARRRRGKGRRGPEQATEAAPETTMRRLARFLFGERREEEETPGTAEPRAEAVAKQASDDSAAVEAGRARAEESRQGSPPRRREARSAGRPARRSGGEDRAHRGQREERRRSGRGSAAGRERERERHAGDRPAPDRERGREARGRRGGRGVEPRQPERPPVADDVPLEETRREPVAAEEPRREPVAAEEPRREPVAAEEPRREPVAAEEPRHEPEREAEPTVAPAPLPGAPRTTIRGRWGTRGRYRPSQEPPPVFEGQLKPSRTGEAGSPPASSGTPDAPAAASGDQSPAGEQEAAALAEGQRASQSNKGELVSRLTHYPGVGERTAQSLVEAFGADVFRVIDQEPERVRELLPDHRAERVLQARRGEVEAGGQ